MIRLGIVGCNYGRTVLLPAFRADPRCAVEALCGSDEKRTATLAQESAIPKSFSHWEKLLADDNLDAVAIATPPRLQSQIALAALKSGKAVFAEKPLAADLPGAKALFEQARKARPLMIDFEFPELPIWQRAKTILQNGGIGTLRHLVINWQIENYATRMRLRSWKTNGDDGGGALGNFVSHCFHYIEDFCGPLSAFSAKLSALPGADPSSESSVFITGQFATGAALSLSVSCASYLGSGHHIAFYGEDGTLMLINTGADYMRGFTLWHGQRPAEALTQIDVPNPHDNPAQDGRIAPVSRLAQRFLDAIENDTVPVPGIKEAYRVQYLIDAAHRAHQSGHVVEIETDGAHR